MSETFYTTSDLSHIERVSGQTVRNEIKFGRLKPDARTGAGAALFTPETAERWAESRRQAREAKGGA